MSTSAIATAQEDLEKAVNSIFHVPTLESPSDENKPTLRWLVYYTQQKRIYSDLPKNVFYCVDPSNEINFEKSIKEANDIFTKMFPEDPFLPDKDFLNKHQQEQQEIESKLTENKEENQDNKEEKNQVEDENKNTEITENQQNETSEQIVNQQETEKQENEEKNN